MSSIVAAPEPDTARVKPAVSLSLPKPAPANFYVAPRSPAVDPLFLARYYRQAFLHVDMGTFAKIVNGKGPKLIGRLEPSEVPRRQIDLLTSSEEGGGAKPIYAMAVLSAVPMRKRNDVIDGRRYPILAVPAQAVVEDKQFWLAAASDTAPIANPRCFYPMGEDCDVGDFGRFSAELLQSLAKLGADEELNIGWQSWWDTCLGALLRATDAEDLAMLEQRACSQLPAYEKQTWALRVEVFAQEGATNAAVRELDAVYAELISRLERGDKALGCYPTFCGTGNSAVAPERIPISYRQTFGHMDAYGGGKRELFPLDPTQRRASRAILSLQSGQVQAVNGPPGSGKTSMLRAVVASKWVEAALDQAPCPIVLACGTTNQSVTNVIGAFGEAPHLDDKLLIARRWIPDVPSYGAYLPSQSQLKKDGKDDSKDVTKQFICLQKAATGSLYAFVGRSDVLDPARALEFEVSYLQSARAQYPDIQLTRLEDAVAAVHGDLHTHVETVIAHAKAYSEHPESRTNFHKRARARIGQCAEHWHVDRVEIAGKCLTALERASTEHGRCDIDALDDLIDLLWRADAFHLAARYWEGRFLLAQRTRLFSRHPKNVEEQLRRLCMLTPCLVATCHLTPTWCNTEPAAGGNQPDGCLAIGLIDLLLIDEAGMVSPELGACLLGLAQRTAFIGDIKQLDPIWSVDVVGESAIVAGLTEDTEVRNALIQSGRSVAGGSMLRAARLVSHWRDPDDDGVTLRYHYRCAPPIIEYCNYLSYGGVLRTRTKTKDGFWPPPLSWVALEEGPSKVGSGSFCNVAEAEEIVSWVLSAWPKLTGNPGMEGKTIDAVLALLTPYRAQSEYLAKRLKEEFDRARRMGTLGECCPSSQHVKDVVIGTVHKLQGAERPVICFSLVEGPEQMPSQFMDGNGAMLNVAASRAKHALVVFGHRDRFLVTEVKPGTQLKDLALQGLPPSILLGAYLKLVAKPLYPRHLAIIEAPGKLVALRHVLGKEFRVEATGGSLWSLDLKEGVDDRAGLAPRPTLRSGAEAVIKRIAQAAQSVESVLLLTDDDRMGDYIAWQASRLTGLDAKGLPVKRARMGAITPGGIRDAITRATEGVDEARVLAEITREVADQMLTRYLSAYLDNVLNHKGVRSHLLSREQFWSNLGAMDGTNKLKTTSKTLGRVQAGILGLVAGEIGRKAAAPYSHWVRIDLGGRSLEGRILGSLGPQWTVGQVSPSCNVEFTVLDVTEDRLPADIAGAGTVELLAGAWRRYAMPPGTTMRRLQALYEGSWAQCPQAPADPIDPIEIRYEGAGHPPVLPLDRAKTPDTLFIGATTEDVETANIYRLIWMWFEALECTSATYRRITVRGRLHGYGDIEFTGMALEGLPSEFYKPLDGVSNEELLLCELNKGPNSPEVLQELAMLRQVQPRNCRSEAPQAGLTLDELLYLCQRMGIGKPSSLASSLQSLIDREIVLPSGPGKPLSLSRAGVWIAELLGLPKFPADYEGVGKVGKADFSTQLERSLTQIENGLSTPRDVLEWLVELLGPSHFKHVLPDAIWSNMTELNRAMANAQSEASEAPQLISPPGAYDPLCQD
ncbi:AAA domain-containing protein [Undibacterium griseum]|uniref:Toprim domain-containing protein n=1 Tax=Undibacterium griseum TaxID=2762295 RepID=A0ABR6YMC9_9BURK|nr:AAA domain-containing protein [Undibacterium griseum]MBC3884950.1 hypothetical protein [Undibacterium griseum]